MQKAYEIFGLAQTLLVNEIDKSPSVVDRCLLVDAMTQVEDVARFTGRLMENMANAVGNGVAISQQDSRIEITLDGSVRSDRLPCLIQVDSPIDADHVSTRIGEQRQQGRITRGKVNQRYRGD